MTQAALPLSSPDVLTDDNVRDWFAGRASELFPGQRVVVDETPDRYRADQRAVGTFLEILRRISQTARGKDTLLKPDTDGEIVTGRVTVAGVPCILDVFTGPHALETRSFVWSKGVENATPKFSEIDGINELTQIANRERFARTRVEIPGSTFEL